MERGEAARKIRGGRGRSRTRVRKERGEENRNKNETGRREKRDSKVVIDGK